MKVLFAFILGLALMRSVHAAGPWTPQSIEVLKYHLQTQVDIDGRVTPQLQESIYRLEKKYFHTMDPEIQARFQTAVGEIGGKVKSKHVMPVANTPFWLLKPHRFHEYQSTPNLPSTVDYLIVGAGLTGASAAYHLLGEIQKGKSVVTVDSRGVSEGASGRNGGNFGPYPENFVDAYIDLATERYKFLKSTFPRMSEEKLQQTAIDQAKVLVRFSRANGDLFMKIVREEGLQVDLSDKGFLHRAETPEEERALIKDVALANAMGIKTEYWSAKKIKQVLNQPGEFAGRFAMGYGNYHPYKFVTQLFEKVVDRGAKLYTQTRVLSIDSSTPGNQPVLVHTNRGIIRARNVIVATDAYTAKILPELEGIIEAYQSQIFSIEHVENYLRGMTISQWNGDEYFNGPKSTHYVDKNGRRFMMLDFGSGSDRFAPDPDNPPLSEPVFEFGKSRTDFFFPDTINRPVSRIWNGVFGFSRDRFLVLGYHVRNGKTEPRIVLATASGGFGGSVSEKQGEAAAIYAIRNENPSPEVSAKLRAIEQLAPPQYFSVKRFKNISKQCKRMHQ